MAGHVSRGVFVRKKWALRIALSAALIAATVLATMRSTPICPSAALERRGLVCVKPDPRDSRQRLIALSDEGVKLHGWIMLVAKERARRLLSPFTKEEVRVLTGLLRRMHANAINVNAFDPHALLASADGPKARARR